MANISKTLGQTNAGAVLTDLYTAPKGSATTATVIVCNRGVFADTYRIAIAPGGAADHPRQYIQYNKVIAANDSDTIGGLFLKAGDVIRVYSSVADISFTAMGIEST